MITFSFSAQLANLMPVRLSTWISRTNSARLEQRPPLSELVQQDAARLPFFVRESAVAIKYLQLLGPLDWSRFPERPDLRFWPDCRPLPYATLAAAYLVKLDQHLPYVADLRDYLVEHPALVWVLGFPVVTSHAYPWGFDVEASLPTHRHLSRMLRLIPNAPLQFLLDETVRLLQAELGKAAPDFGDCISLDTKHIIAWVKENNPKAYVKDRYDKTRQPTGDPDCRLGCKRRTNQRRIRSATSNEMPTADSTPANTTDVGEFYWGYGSGIVVTQVPDWGEFVLAELTQPFDQPDVSYFKPLMAQTERRLGHAPRFGAFDAAFDAFYVYEYFADAHGFAAVPLVERGGHAKRAFSEDGRPLCAANLPMFLRYTFRSRKSMVEHECGRYACPLRFPDKAGETCPIRHKNWRKGGCTTTMATSPGARIRYQLDRESEAYHSVYKQRTASERISSQAVDLGIERPKLRNGQSIINHNTLTYVLINLHALQRIRQRLAERPA
jgi:hypothetical protein